MKHFILLVNRHGDFYAPPRPVQGRGLTYGTAYWNPRINRLVCRIPAEQWSFSKHEDILAAQSIGNIWSVESEFECEDGQAFSLLTDAIAHEKGETKGPSESNVIAITAPLSRELIMRSSSDRLRHIAQGVNLPNYRKFPKREDLEKALLEFCGYPLVEAAIPPPETIQLTEAVS